MSKRFIIVLFVSWFLFVALWAQIPANYYASAQGMRSAELKTALFRIIRTHEQIEYYSLSTQFKTTDWHPNGYFWDVYSDNVRGGWSGLNREHSMPKSWFGVEPEQVNDFQISTDVHNLYPSDASVNSEKSNYPLGIAGNSQPLINLNSRCKVGDNTYPGYTGKVFEPSSEYKGDFARTYMYMVTCYEDYYDTWRSLGTASMLQRNTYPVFNTYAVKLLMEWHRADPVSSKEINRNNAVFRLQKNRNPFVDYPILAEYLWGKFTNEIWDGTTDEPETAEPLVFTYKQQSKSLYLKLKKPILARYEIYTLSGKLLQADKCNSNSTVSVSELKKGPYILAVYAGGRKKTARILIY